MALGLALSEDGSLIVVGRAEVVVGPVSWGWTAKISRDGELLWDRDWTSLSNLSALFAATTSRSGRVIAVGDILPPEGGNARRALGLVLKIDGEGSLEWRKTLDLGAMTKITAVVEDGTGGAMIGAIVKRESLEPALVARVSAAGEITQVTPISDDAGLVLGLRRIFGEGYLVIDNELVRLDGSGRPLWRQVGDFRDAAAFPDGGVVAIRLAEHVEMVRFSMNGTRLWERRVEDPAICQPVGVWTRGADEIVVASDPCDGSELASVTVFSGDGDRRSLYRIRVGPGKHALAAQLDPWGRIVMAGIEGLKGWVFRSEAVLGRRE